MSRVIKSQWTNALPDEQKVISIKKIESIMLEEQPADPFHTAAMQNQMLAHSQAEAESIVKEAESRAQSILEQVAREKEAWEREKAVLVEEAKREGFLKGVVEGKETGYNECHNSILFAQEVVNASQKDYQLKITSAEKTILQIGLKVAGKILGEKLDNGDGFLSLVKNAIKEAREYQEVKLQVNPCHYEFLLARKEELSAIFPNNNDIYIYPNDELSEKACIIESANGRIDAGVDIQLEEIKRKLIELLESES